MYFGFAHIAKTGGQTIASHMQQINFEYANKKGVQETFESGILGPNFRRTRDSKILYTGSDHNFVHEFESHEKPIDWFTFLRDPIDRCYSYMNMVVRNQLNVDRPLITTPMNIPNPWTAQLTPEQIMPKSWRNLIRNSFALNNAMCWQLGMQHDPNWTASALKKRNPALNNNHTCETCGAPGIYAIVPPRLATEELYESAIKNLEKSYYVGDFANFEHDATEIIDKICSAYDVKIELQLRHLNKHDYDKNIPEYIKSLLIETNQYDIKLYEYCKKNFFKRT